MSNPICVLCGNEILPKEIDALYFEQKVHLECVHDMQCTHEENERF